MGSKLDSRGKGRWFKSQSHPLKAIPGSIPAPNPDSFNKEKRNTI
jgi:hypothetical protein